MSDTGKQSPLGVNVLGTLLQHQGFYINPKVVNLAGTSKTNSDYAPGAIVSDTCLKWLTYAINDAYVRGYPSETNITVDNQTYENLINIGQSRIPALGNSPPPSYLIEDPSGVWTGAATSGYADDVNPEVDPAKGQGQQATWFPFTCGGADPEDNNPNIGASQWGWIRLIALQAWNEFNYNGESVTQDPPQYQYFLQSFLAAQGFIDYSNKALYALEDSKDYLKGIYSNMDDLTTNDITGVSLANRAFGQDLINLGKAMDLSYIATFGLPSNLLKTLKKNNALTPDLNFALVAAGFTNNDITSIINDNPATFEQEQNLYAAFSVITDKPLKEILQTLNCKTKNITSLIDLLNIKKLFPISYPSLTVPIYNTEPSPTNSKTYYLLFINGQLNPQLIAPSVVELTPEVVPPTPPPEPPLPVVLPAPPIETVEEVITTPDLPIPPAGGIGGGGGCPAPWTKITLADNTLIEAGKIEPGMYVYTRHETKDVWGSYKVTAKETSRDMRWIVTFEDNTEFVGTYNHRVKTDVNWSEIRNLVSGDKVVKQDGFITVVDSKYLDEGDVVKITVEDAHTYLTEGFLSHNVKMIGGGGGCVALESYVPLVELEKTHNQRPITHAWMLENGMKISLGTDDLEIVDGQIKMALNDYQPCVRISTSDGISLVCSTTARILTKENGFTIATELYGKRVAVMRNGRTWYDEVVGIDDVGMKFVRVIDAGDKSFWAGEKPGAFILHHNVPIFDDYNIAKN